MDCNFASKLSFMSTISSFSLLVSILFNRISRSRSSLVQTGTEISGFSDLNFLSAFFSLWAQGGFAGARCACV